jgi:hypothetical protein
VSGHAATVVRRRFLDHADHEAMRPHYTVGDAIRPRCLIVNNSRLQGLLYTSENFMNACFDNLGYKVMQPAQEILLFCSRALPNVTPDLFEIRQWCVRVAQPGTIVEYPAILPLSAITVVQQPNQAIPRRRGGAEDDFFRRHASLYSWVLRIIHRQEQDMSDGCNSPYWTDF